MVSVAVNRRLLDQAIDNVYKPYLLGFGRPFVVLRMRMEPADVTFNVAPSKREVCARLSDFSVSHNRSGFFVLCRILWLSTPFDTLIETNCFGFCRCGSGMRPKSLETSLQLLARFAELFFL